MYRALVCLMLKTSINVDFLLRNLAGMTGRKLGKHEAQEETKRLFEKQEKDGCKPTWK